eukprot:TRINITY_DN39253_c0_g1_i1.p1 TRINITY_DN39253_c0_g1~~TRINITY_DN39253_c0_g1_i1.p1  ORF type:complete len:539 (+),score=140.97 TRINITY_DN39253_c0_g1_i1:155-1771(+)
MADDKAELRAALAAKGYDLVGESAAGEDDSDSDGMFDLPGRITSLEPNVAREKGKKLFEKGKYEKAIKAWQGGLKNILSSLCSGPEALNNKDLSELDLTLNLNIAMAYMKQGQFEQADRSVDKALARRDALPPHLVTKALYRKASAQRSMRRLEECMETLKDLLEVEKGQAAALQMLQEVEREHKKQCKAQKANLKNLFSKLQDEDKKEADTRRKYRADLRTKSGIQWVKEDDVDAAAFEQGDVPGCDGKDWGLALSRTLLWAMEELAVEGTPCMSSDTSDISMWFLGASSTCELRHLQPDTVMKRIPQAKALNLTLVGFLGDKDPDNSVVPDPQANKLPEGLMKTERKDERTVSLRAFKGTLQEALDRNFGPPPGEAASTDGAAGKESGSTGGYNTVAESSKDANAGGAVSSTAPATSKAEEVEPPTVCFIAHPQLHRYFTDFFPAITWLIRKKVPTVVIGASEPDLSWKQDEVLLRAIGAEITVGKRVSPYPMCLPDDDRVRKCNHVIGFVGGKAVDRDRLTKIKLELLSQDYTCR